MTSDEFKVAVREGFAAWATAHGGRRRKLVANFPFDAGVRVVELDKSNWALGYYLRVGVLLGDPGQLVREGECDIRPGVGGPWDGCAFEPERPVCAADVTAVLEHYATPFLDRFSSEARIHALYAGGELRTAAITLRARDRLG